MADNHPGQITRGYLLTRFGNFASHYEVSIGYDIGKLKDLVIQDQSNYAHAKDADHSQLAVFKAAAQVVPGYSGSPVVDDEGHIISLAQVIIPDDQNEELKLYEFVSRTLNMKGILPQIPFMGVRPDSLADFIQSAFTIDR